VRVGAGLLFLVLAISTARANLRREREEEERQVERVERRRGRPFLKAFIVIFLSEWADLSQLATAAFQAKYHQPVVIFIAATLALWVVSAAAIFAGNRLGALLPERPLQWAGAAVMAAVGLALLSGLAG